MGRRTTLSRIRKVSRPRLFMLRYKGPTLLVVGECSAVAQRFQLSVYIGNQGCCEFTIISIPFL